MLEKFEIYIIILILVFLFYVVISLGAGVFSKKEKKTRSKKIFKICKYLINFHSYCWNCFNVVSLKNLTK
jgi:flagellar basal body-associated protein FliL